MGTKPATIAPAAKTKGKEKTKGDPKEVQVARIASSTTIQVTRTQVVCTIVAALLALLGVAIANLDKFSHSNSTETANKLLIDSKAERARSFIEKNSRDAQNAQKALTTEDGISKQHREKISRVLDTYKIENLEHTTEFIKAKGVLDTAIATNNAAATEASRQRLNQILVEEAESLQDTINTVNETIPQPKTDTGKESDKQLRNNFKHLRLYLELNLFKRNPIKEVAELLPIKRQDSSAKMLESHKEAKLPAESSSSDSIESNLFNSYTKPTNPSDTLDGVKRLRLSVRFTF
jgi:hypothetical protein